MSISQWTKEQLSTLLGQVLCESQFEEAFRKTDGWPLLSQLMHVDLRTYLPDAMLTKVDRASMAVGLEVRVPLLDHRVVEYSTRLPDSLKHRNGIAKYLLKRLLAQYVPTDLFERPKMGFGIPLDAWFRGQLKHLLSDYLSTARLKAEGLFDPAVVEEKLHDHLSGKADHNRRLWSLLMWEMWRERWLGA
jgi:asparagine synthase (glutamine-hydrolysing)